jgi:hypothetical protein
MCSKIMATTHLEHNFGYGKQHLAKTFLGLLERLFRFRRAREAGVFEASILSVQVGVV